MGFPCSSAGNEGDPGSIPGSGRSPGEGIGYPFQYSWASLVAQMVKNPPAMWETWVRSLGWEDPLEEVMAAHPSILAWRIPMDRGAWRATVHRVTESQTREQPSTAQHEVHTHMSLSLKSFFTSQPKGSWFPTYFFGLITVSSESMLKYKCVRWEEQSFYTDYLPEIKPQKK